MAVPAVAVGAARVASKTVDLAKSVWAGLPDGVKTQVTSVVEQRGFKAPSAAMSPATATAVLQEVGRSDNNAANRITMELQPYMSEPTVQAIVNSFSNEARGLVGAAGRHVSPTGATLTAANAAKIKLIRSAASAVGGAQNLLALSTCLNAVNTQEIAAYIANRSLYASGSL